MTRLYLYLIALVLFTGSMASAATDFSGIWRQTGRGRGMEIKQHDAELKVKVSHGTRTLDLKYEIGGNELVYTGLDGDEFHTKVRWDGPSLVFETVEHERGKEFVSRQVWTLSDEGNDLKVEREADKDGKTVKSVETYERSKD